MCYSIDAQLHARDMALTARSDWTLVDTYIDEGKSAFRETLERPALQRLLVDVRSGRIDAVFVHKLDRFSRRLVVTLQLIEEFRKRGVTFLSINENFDLGTPFGWLMFQQMGGYAEFYSQNLSFETKKGLREKARQGRFVGRVPLGYDRDAHGVLQPNPDAPAVQLAFDLYATGHHTIGDVAAIFNARGYRSQSSSGRVPFTESALRKILHNPVYVGRIQCAGETYAGLHEPIVAEPVHDAVARLLAQRTQWHGSAIHHDSPLLSGLIWCAACREKAHVRRPSASRSADTYTYHCYNARQHRCDERSVPARPAEQALLAWLSRIPIGADLVDEAIAVARQQLTQEQPIVARIGLSASQIRERLRRIGQLYADEMIDEASYTLQRAELQRLQREVEPFAPARLDETKARALVADLPAVLATDIPAVQRSFVHALFDRIWLKDRRIIAVTPRGAVFPLVAALTTLSIGGVTCVSDGNPLRRLLVRSKGVEVVGVLESHGGTS